MGTWKKLAYQDDVITKALLTEQGDILYASGVATPAALAHGLATQYLKSGGHGANPSWDTPAGGAATKEFFVPVTFGTEISSDLTFPVARVNAATEVAFVSFQVPSDFTSLTNAQLIVIPKATKAAADWDISSTYGAVGEAYNTHTESNTATTYNVTNGTLFAIDISGILASLTANDYVGIKILQVYAGDAVNVVGVRFKYS